LLFFVAFNNLNDQTIFFQYRSPLMVFGLTFPMNYVKSFLFVEADGFGGQSIVMVSTFSLNRKAFV